MADIPNDETAEKPIGTSVLLGLLVGIISLEIVYQKANSYLWFSLAGAIPGLYLMRALIRESVKSNARYRVRRFDDREKTSG